MRIRLILNILLFLTSSVLFSQGTIETLVEKTTITGEEKVYLHETDVNWNRLFIKLGSIKSKDSVYNGLSKGSIRWGQEVGKSGDPAKLVFDTEIPMNEKSIYFKNNGVDGLQVSSSLDGYTRLRHPSLQGGDVFFWHKPNTDLGNAPTFLMGTGSNLINSMPHSNYVYAMGLNAPLFTNNNLDVNRGGLSLNFEGLYDGLGGIPAQEFHIVHYKVPNSPSSAHRVITGWFAENPSNGSDLGINIGKDDISQNAFYINDQDGSLKVRYDWQGNKQVLEDSIGILVNTNNVPAIIQKNNSGSSIEIARVDDNNLVSLVNNQYAFESTQSAIHTKGVGLQIGTSTYPILQAPLFVASAQDNLLRLRRSDVSDEFTFKGNSNYFSYNFQGKNIFYIDNSAPNNFLYVASNKIGVGGTPAFGRFAINGTESGIGLSIFGGSANQDAIYINGTATGTYNLMRMDFGATDKLKLPISNNSGAANSTVEVNLQSGSSTGKNYISFGDNTSGNGWQFGCNRAVGNNLIIYSAGDKMTGGTALFEVIKGGGLIVRNLKVAVDDAAAASVGCVQNEVYKTPTGELRIKL